MLEKGNSALGLPAQSTGGADFRPTCLLRTLDRIGRLVLRPRDDHGRAISPWRVRKPDSEAVPSIGRHLAQSRSDRITLIDPGREAEDVELRNHVQQQAPEVNVVDRIEVPEPVEPDREASWVTRGECHHFAGNLALQGFAVPIAIGLLHMISIATVPNGARSRTRLSLFEIENENRKTFPPSFSDDLANLGVVVA